MRSNLWDKIAINGVEIKNRLVVAPMTTQQSHADGSLSKNEQDWLERLSQDGYGIVITCAASISDTATAFENQLSLAHDRFLPDLQLLTANMKRNNSVNIVQLCHAGSRALENLTGVKPKSASSFEMPNIPDFSSPEELSQNEIQEIVEDFARACVRAEKAGFDGVEIHGANGYLFTQFISKMTNFRTDEYGGSLENRARLSLEVVTACRKVVSEKFIIGFRLSFEPSPFDTGLDIDENIQIANWLGRAGVNYVHSSQMNYAMPSVKYGDELVLSYLRKHIDSNLPLVMPGSINSVEDAEKALELGADFVAIGRSAIAHIKLPELFLNREQLPFSTPFSIAHLKEIGISDAFVDYLMSAPPLRSLNIVEK